MGKTLKIASWIFGLIVLIVLIRYPIETKDSWQTWSLPLAGQIIVIDPGHGGVDGGAVGADETLEKDIALKVSKYLRDYLQQAGALVYLTREKDVDLADDGIKSLSKRKSQDLRRRVEFIDEKEADFFVSVHLNAIPSKKWSGAQSFYNPASPEGERLAKFIQAEIKRNLENTTRNAMAKNNMFLLKQTESPGALIEIGFLSNVHERDLLKTDPYRKKVAASIYEGILRFVTENELPNES